jgi:glycosyltransferase-like protein
VLHAQDSISGNALAELRAEGTIRGFVRTVHHLDAFRDPRLAQWQRRAYADADAVFCVSEVWTQMMKTRFGVEAVTVSNGVDVQRFRAARELDDVMLPAELGVRGDPVVLAVGGIEERKNTLQLLEAFALLRKTRRDAQLVIAGGASLLDHDAYTRRFAARAAELGLPIGLGEAVVVTGALDDDAIPALMRRADAVAMVSLREGFGLVVLEALSSGVPVVVSRIAPFTEYLNARVCYWAEPHDAHSIAAALQRAFDDRRGIDFTDAVSALLQRFSWRASAQRHLALYRGCTQPATA